MIQKHIQDNINLNYQEMLERKPILKSYPIKIYVEPTQRCNIKCYMCDRNRKRDPQDMSMELFKKIKMELFDYVGEVNFFLGGEPTLAEHFNEMIKVCDQYSFLPKVFTNAAALSKETMELLVIQGFFVNISFDAATPALLEKIRFGAKYNNILKNILYLQEYNRKVNNPRFHIRLAATMGKENVSEAPRIIQFAKDHLINDVMFGSMDIIDSWENRLADASEQSAALLKEAKAMADQYKIRFSCSKKIGPIILEKNDNWDDFSLPIDESAPLALESANPFGGDCGYPWIQFIVRTNGMVVSCCQRLHCLGDFAKDSFWDIWNNQDYQVIRTQKDFHNCMGKTCNMADYSIWRSGKFR